MFPVIGAIAQAVGNQFSTDINRKLDRESNVKLMNKQQELALQQMAVQNDYNRQNLLDSPSFLVNGLRAAGLNPAAAAGSSTSVAGGSIAGTPSSSAGSMYGKNFDIAGIASQFAQVENLEAATAKMRADTRKTEIENENASGENAAVKDSLLMAIKRQKDVYESFGISTGQLDELEKYVKDTENLNVGSLRSIANSINIEKLLSNGLREKLEDIFTANFNAKSIESDIAQNYIDMSKFAKKLQAKQYALMAQQISLMLSEKKVNDEQVKKIAQEVKNLQQEIKNAQSNKQLTDQEYEHLVNNDFNTLWHDGKKGEAIRVLIGRGLEAAAGLAPLIMMRGKPAPIQNIQKQGAKKSKKYKLYNADGQPTFYEDSDDFNSILR